MKKNDETMIMHEKKRIESLREIGNHLHESNDVKITQAPSQ
jgi:hypothetical protein